jgi:hypothetical protein
MMQTRRDILTLASRAMALPNASQFFAVWLTAAEDHKHTTNIQAPPEPALLRDYKPQFFKQDDFNALQAFTEILIPTDDTPGAREAHCAHYIDFVLQAASEYAPEMQTEWRRAMDLVRQTGFHKADGQERARIVEAMSLPERDRSKTHPAFPAFRLIKEMNTFAFYTSRAGIIETLEYKGNAYLEKFPGCDHPEHRRV